MSILTWAPIGRRLGGYPFSIHTGRLGNECKSIGVWEGGLLRVLDEMK